MLRLSGLKCECGCSRLIGGGPGHGRFDRAAAYGERLSAVGKRVCVCKLIGVECYYFLCCVQCLHLRASLDARRREAPCAVKGQRCPPTRNAARVDHTVSDSRRMANRLTPASPADERAREAHCSWAHAYLGWNAPVSLGDPLQRCVCARS